jgi:hypothetical protein
MTPFSWMFVIPVPKVFGKLSNVYDLASIYNYTSPSEMTYKMYIMKFDMFFNKMIEDLKNKYYLVSLIYSTKTQTDVQSDKIIYLRYDTRNEYKWYNYELTDVTRSTSPFSLS